MTPIILDPPPAPDLTERYTIQLGRVRFPTYRGDFTRTLGNGLEAVGTAVFGADPRPRDLKLTVPIYGDAAEADPKVIADRLRRQVIALFENDAARLPGLYLRLSSVAGRDAWVVAGAGELSDADGGPSLGEYVLELSDLKRIGSSQTHREGRRLRFADRRIATVPRDVLGTVYSVDFASQAALALHFLPVRVSDAIGTGRQVLALTTRQLLGGDVAVLAGCPQDDVVTFEQPAADVGAGPGDVVIYDRRANPTAVPVGDPQLTAGWEEVYGPDQDLTSEDVPAIENGLCRVRWVPYTGVDGSGLFALDTYDPVAGAYVERGRVTLWQESTVGVYSRYVSNAAAEVVAWTPERAVLKIVMRLAGNAQRAELYLTLQRGWTGPRFELYPQRSDGIIAGGIIRYSPAGAVNAGMVTLRLGAASVVRASDDGIGWTGLDYGVFSGGTAEPVQLFAPVDNLSPAVAIAVVQGAATALSRDDTAAYGDNRRAVEIAARFATAAAGYCSATFGHSPYRFAEAETIMAAGGTRTQVADAAAGAGQAVEDTQAAATADTVTGTGTSLGLPIGRYGAWARVRVVDAGATGSFRFVDAGAGATFTTTSTTYVWLYLGEQPLDLVGDLLRIKAWRSAGTGPVRIDRVIYVALERRHAGDAPYDGVRDHAQANLADARQDRVLAQR